MLPYKFLMPELLDSRGLKLCRKDTNPNPVLEMDFEILEINASFTNTTRKEFFPMGIIESKSSSKDSFNTLRPGSGLIFRRTFNKPNLIECSMKKYCGKHLEDTADDILRIARRNNWLKMDESTKRQISELRKSMYRPVFGTFFKTMGFDFCCRDSYNSRISFLRSMLGLFHKNRFLADFESDDASQPIPEPLNLPYTCAQGRNAQVGSFDDCAFAELDMDDESIEILEPFACPTSADCSNFK